MGQKGNPCAKYVVLQRPPRGRYASSIDLVEKKKGFFLKALSF